MHWPDRIRRLRRLGLSSLLCLAAPCLALAQTATTPAKPAQASAAHSAKSKHHSSGHAVSGHAGTKRTSTQKGKHGKGTSKKSGQKAIDSARAREIQTALVREHYLQGEPSGTWDSATQAAMQRYQADHGWQSKTTPDSRALIKLGLGPSHDHLLNPESAMTATPAAGDPKVVTKQPPPQSSIPQH